MNDNVIIKERSSFHNRLTIFLHALAFVIGFSLVFVVGWGGTATLLGSLFREYKDWIARLGGAILIVFGLTNILSSYLLSRL